MPILPPLRLTGAVVLRDGVLQRRSVALANGRISKGPFPAVDMSGYWLLPGIVDLSSSAIHNGKAGDNLGSGFETAIADCENAAVQVGVTTTVLTHRWSWENPDVSPTSACKFAEALEAYRRRALTDIHMQLRVETHLIESESMLLALCQSQPVTSVMFASTVEDTANPEDTEVIQRRTALKAREKDVPRFLCRLAEAFDAEHIRYGSHRDKDGETREMYSMIGARICEFPMTRRAAASAKAVNDPVICSANDFVNGSTEGGQGVAKALIRDRLCDAMASDGDFRSLVHAIWTLIDQFGLGLTQAWPMISDVSAQLLGLPDRGRIEYGRRADLVLINQKTREVEATICAGRLVHVSGDAVQRFADSADILPMAAE